MVKPDLSTSGMILTPIVFSFVAAAFSNSNALAGSLALTSAAAKLKSIGVKIVTDIDKKSFTGIADPYLDKLAKDLGPHAEKIKNLIRAVN